jgi:chaperonin GroES
MNLKPLSDRLIVKPLDNEEKTESGIIVPDTAKEKPMQGEVMAVGPGRMDDTGKRIKMDVKVGDRVMYGKYSGTEFKMDKVDFLIMNENDVLAIFN